MAELHQVFEKPILRLKVLRRQESPLGPDHRLQIAHKKNPKVSSSRSPSQPAGRRTQVE
jgi:hypothetical protein